MSRVLPICFPASDVIFGERVRRVIARSRWDLQSPEGIALMQAVLRKNYPLATVLPEIRTLDGAWQPIRVVAVHRDGRQGRSDQRSWHGSVHTAREGDARSPT